MISSKSGFIPQSDKYSKFMAGESLKKYIEIHKGEFAYNKGNSLTYPYGCVYQLKDYETAAVPFVYFCFRQTNNTIHQDYLDHYFRAGQLNNQLKPLVNSGVRNNGLLNIHSEEFYDITIGFPPLGEQRKIAAILSSVDEAIEATQAVIDQLGVVKKAMMAELLTRGLPGRHTRFKQTAIGEVPEEWEMVRLGDVAAVDYGISAAVAKNRDPGIGWPIITGANLTLDGQFDLSSLSYYPPPKSPRHLLQQNDLLLNWRSGSAKHVGKTVLFNLAGDYTYASFVLRIRSNGRLNPTFGHVILNYMREQEYFSRDLSQQVNFKMNAAVFREVPIKLPGLEEQKLIGIAHQHVDGVINLHCRQKDQLSALKSALMSVLLTGEVRVEPDEVF